MSDTDALGAVFRPASKHQPSARPTPPAAHDHDHAQGQTNGAAHPGFQRSLSQPSMRKTAPSVQSRLQRLQQRRSVGQRGGAPPPLARLASPPQPPNQQPQPQRQPQQQQQRPRPPQRAKQGRSGGGLGGWGARDEGRRGEGPRSSSQPPAQRANGGSGVAASPRRPQPLARSHPKPEAKKHEPKKAAPRKGDVAHEPRSTQPAQAAARAHEPTAPASRTPRTRSSSQPAFRRGLSRDQSPAPPSPRPARVRRSESSSAALSSVGSRVRAMFEGDAKREGTARHHSVSSLNAPRPPVDPAAKKRSSSVDRGSRVTPSSVPRRAAPVPPRPRAPVDRLRALLPADMAALLATHEDNNEDASLTKVAEAVQAAIGQWGDQLTSHRSECAACRVALAHVDETEGVDLACSTRHVHAACPKIHRKLQHTLKEAIHSRLFSLLSSLPSLLSEVRPSESDTQRLEAFVDSHDAPTLANLREVEAEVNRLTSARDARVEIFQAIDAQNRLLTAISLFNQHLRDPHFALRFAGSTHVTKERFEVHGGRKVVAVTRMLRAQLDQWESGRAELLFVGGKRYLSECLPSEVELQCAEREVSQLVLANALYLQPIERDGVLTAPQPPVATAHVVVRVRPRLGHEARQRSVIQALEDGSTISMMNGNQSKAMAFSSCVPPHATQEDVFEICNMAAVVDALVTQGISTTVLAVGHTKSGKTHTLYGPEEVVGVQEDDPLQTPVEEEVLEVVEDIRMEHLGRQGLVQRAAALFFATALQLQDDPCVLDVAVSFVEVVKDAVRDLLRSDTPTLQLRSTPVGFEPENATMLPCDGVADVVAAIAQGHARCTRPPPPAASPSHTLFTLHVTASDRQRGHVVRAGSLAFVDLGASEGGEGKAKGDRGLQALKRVVVNLTEGKGGKASGHVPFRDSNLTRLLTQSLSEGHVRVVVACVSPCEGVVDESLRVLDFASRASSLGVVPGGVLGVDDGALEEADGEDEQVGALRMGQVAAEQELQRLRQMLAGTA